MDLEEAILKEIEKYKDQAVFDALVNVAYSRWCSGNQITPTSDHYQQVMMNLENKGLITVEKSEYGQTLYSRKKQADPAAPIPSLNELPNHAPAAQTTQVEAPKVTVTPKKEIPEEPHNENSTPPPAPPAAKPKKKAKAKKSDDIDDFIAQAVVEKCNVQMIARIKEQAVYFEEILKKYTGKEYHWTTKGIFEKK